jgi:hypothetical protein
VTSVLTAPRIANWSAPEMIAWRPRLGAADERTTTVRSPIAFRLSIVPFRIEWRELARKSPECPSTELGMALDPAGFVEFDGMRPHQVHLEGGDASSDSYCFA